MMTEQELFDSIDPLTREIQEWKCKYYAMKAKVEKLEEDLCHYKDLCQWAKERLDDAEGRY